MTQLPHAGPSTALWHAARAVGSAQDDTFSACQSFDCVRRARGARRSSAQDDTIGPSTARAKRAPLRLPLFAGPESNVRQRRAGGIARADEDPRYLVGVQRNLVDVARVQLVVVGSRYVRALRAAERLCARPIDLDRP